MNEYSDGFCGCVTPEAPFYALAQHNQKPVLIEQQLGKETQQKLLFNSVNLVWGVLGGVFFPPLPLTADKKLLQKTDNIPQILFSSPLDSPPTPPSLTG